MNTLINYVGIYLCSTKTLIWFFAEVSIDEMFLSFFDAFPNYLLTIEYRYRHIYQIDVVNFHGPKWSTFWEHQFSETPC